MLALHYIDRPMLTNASSNEINRNMRFSRSMTAELLNRDLFGADVRRVQALRRTKTEASRRFRQLNFILHAEYT